MAKQEIRDRSDPESMRTFMRALLEDVHALERMLAGEWIETGVRRFVEKPGAFEASTAENVLKHL